MTSHDSELRPRKAPFVRQVTLALCLSLFLASAHAQAIKTSPSTSPEWQSLSSAQQQLLAPLQSEWSEMSPSRRSKWLELAARYPGLPVDEQLRVRERVSTWAQLSPAERQQARLGFRAAQQLKADERQAKWEAYQALPNDRRQELSDKATQKQGNAAAPLSTRDGHSKPMPATGAKSMLVPLAPSNLPELPAPQNLLQAKPGASTVLINESKSGLSNNARSRNNKPGFDEKQLDHHTLLPRPRAASGNN